MLSNHMAPLRAFAPLALLGLTLAATPREASVPTSLRTAETHAAMAVGAGSLPETKQHLHHVLNCLEGPKGSAYDAKAGDPCGGHGALDALAEGSANRVRAEKAIELAKVGVTLQDFKPAHDVAQAVQDVLSEATAPENGR